MIPIKLKLRNFMAYRSEVTLDFQGIHLAVLTGENGAGKSSLLDAVTWALWGKARAKRDDELIHLGCTEMEVEYAFGLSDNVYSVIRKRDASGRGRSDLSLRVEEAGGWRTLTENTIRATQEKINRLLRLDYDTFVNSSFLLQGRADEFTTKPAGKRKEILSDILGLEIYELYEERAKKRANEKKEEEAAIVSKIEHIEQELRREPEYRAELAGAQLEADELHQQRQVAEQEMDSLRLKYQAVEYKQRQLEQLRDRLQGAEVDLADIAEAITAAENNMARYRAILERRAEIEEGLQKLKEARQTVKDWDKKLEALTKLSALKHELDRAFDTARAEIEARLEGLAARVGLLSPKAGALESYRDQLAEAQAELETLLALQKEQEERRETLNVLGPEAARLEEQNRQLKGEMEEIKANLTQLKQAASFCPVCQHPLDETHRAEVLARFQSEGTAKGDLFRANVSRFREVTSQQKELQRAVGEAEKKLRALPPMQGRAAALQQSLSEAETAAADLKTAQAEQAELQKQLDTRSFAVDVLADLTEVEAELTGLGYESATHQQARATVEALLHFEESGRDLADANRGIAEANKQLERERGRQDRLLNQLGADRERVDELEKETADFPELAARLNEVSSSVDELHLKERLARDKVAMANQKLSHLAYLGKQRAEEGDRLQQVREVLSIYRELQTAFGKKGIQALLIESAIPEIEDEANKLLGRMTDSRMQIRFETQREAKSGDSTIETLDIRIADEVGARDYELYSGGEAFRVNFAIRVAMSKVLARRAGARLQTLVIDEGFGTQDGQGRERLVEAINAIQNDFEKILVITHIDELKDAFPTRVEVWKSPEGSQVAIR